MKTRLIQIGNSKGIRIPKALIKRYQLGNQIELIPSGNGLLITASVKSRSGWEDFFKNAEPARKDAHGLTWRRGANQFDKEEWTWFVKH
jgi:antitoxin MazE